MAGDDPGEFGVAAPATKPGQHYSFGGIMLCVKGTGRVTIERIDVIRPSGGVRTESFATRPNQWDLGKEGYGAGNERLSAVGFSPDEPATIDKTCEGKKKSSRTGSVELGVEVSKTANETAGGSGLLVRYSSGGERRELMIPFVFRLCSAGDTKTDECSSPEND